MASTTVITQPLLDMAGIPAGTVSTAILGLTVAAAADMLLDAVQLAIANAALTRQNIVSYTLQGQTVTTSMDDANKLVAFLKRMKSTGGPLTIPVSFNG